MATHLRPSIAQHSSAAWNSFFSSESGAGTRIFYFILLAATVVYSAVSIIAPLVTPVCDIPLDTLPNGTHHRLLGQGLEGGLEDAPNPSYEPDPCRWKRYTALLGMNKWECDMSRRIVISILMGSIIGFERRRADRPAGIRTMAMVCLGACVFTLGSMFAFVDGSMGWDASRVSAAIPSGVGFLGAASIWKGTKSVDGGAEVPEVHGLTTATSVWLSAAIGILCGGGLYVPGLFTTGAGVIYLRFAPRLSSDSQNTYDNVESGSGIDIPSEPTPAETLLEPLSPQTAAGAGASPTNTPRSSMTGLRSPGPSWPLATKPSIHV